MSESFQIFINDLPCQVTSDMSLEKVIATFGATEPYALVLNSDFIPQSQRTDITLKEGDRLDVVSAIQGG